VRTAPNGAKKPAAVTGIPAGDRGPPVLYDGLVEAARAAPTIRA